MSRTWVWVLAAIGCDNTGTIPPTWELEEFRSTHVRAAIGERVELYWQYSTDDAVASQELCSFWMHFNGIGESCKPLDPTTRAVGFDFPGSVRLVLRAQSEDGRHAQGTLELLTDQDAYMVAELSGTHAAFPYLGEQSRISFTQFAAIHDDDDDARMDFLIDNGVFADTNHHFFRARTADPTVWPNNRFSYYQGPYYPWSTATVPNAFDGIPDYANLIVTGGAIVVSGGETLTYKPDVGDEDGVWRRGPELYYDEIIVQAAYLYGEQSLTLTPVDVQVGNLSQGLVLGIASTSPFLVFANGYTNTASTFGTPHNAQTDGVFTTGVVKGARVNYEVAPEPGDLVPVAVQLSTLEWAMEITTDDLPPPQTTMFACLPEGCEESP